MVGVWAEDWVVVNGVFLSVCVDIGRRPRWMARQRAMGIIPRLAESCWQVSGMRKLSLRHTKAHRSADKWKLMCSRQI